MNQIIAIEQGEKARTNKATVPLFHSTAEESAGMPSQQEIGG